MDIELAKISLPFGDEPCGEDCRETETFQGVLVELNKGEGLDPQPVNWKLVATGAYELLSTETKDVELLSYLALAMFNLDGFQGLSTGLQAYEDVANADYWEQVFPRREKKPGKLRAKWFSWLGKKLEKKLSQIQLSQDMESTELEALIQMEKGYRNLEFALGDKLGDDLMTNGNLRSHFRQLKQDAEYLLNSQQQSEDTAKPEDTVEQPKPNDKPAKPAVVQKVIDAFTGNSDKKSLETPAALEKSLKQTQQHLILLAEAFKAKERYHPNRFWFSRMAGWAIFQQAPASGVLPQMPVGAKITQYEEQLQQGKYESLIESIENEFESGAAVQLVLHRFVYHALQALEQHNAASVIATSVQQLVARYPEWLTNTFQGDIPFVDTQTQQWIKGGGKDAHSRTAVNELVTDVSPPAHAAPTSEKTQPGWILAHAEVKQQLSTSNMQGAIAVFDKGLAQSANERERAYWRLSMADFFLETGREDIALSQLAFLRKTIDTAKVAEWEPTILAHIVKSLVAAHQKVKAKRQYSPDEEQHYQQVLTQLQVYDPVAALQL